MNRTRSRALLVLGAASIAAAAWRAPLARADDDEAESISKQVRAQMEKIVRLMRESESSLLDASRGGRAKPAPVDVAVPPAPPAMGEPSPEAGAPPPSAPPGEKAARALEDALSGARTTGAKVPHELEELVRMIPH